jgi:hypothetical protein
MGGIAKDWSRHKHKFDFLKKQSFLKNNLEEPFVVTGSWFMVHSS